MTQLSSKGREKRRNRYKAMLIELRLLGLTPRKVLVWAQCSPTKANIQSLQEAIDEQRAKL